MFLEQIKKQEWRAFLYIWNSHKISIHGCNKTNDD